MRSQNPFSPLFLPRLAFLIAIAFSRGRRLIWFEAATRLFHQ
jgi:hypothetical protein